MKIGASNYDRLPNIYLVGEAESELMFYSTRLDETGWSGPLSLRDAEIGKVHASATVSDDLGNIYVIWLDSRRDPSLSLGFDLYFVTSSDGGVSFGPNLRINDGPIGGYSLE